MRANALIFAAGLGTRLKPWTETHPKALVPVGGEPMLGRVLRKLASMPEGTIGRVVVNVHHFASQVVDYLSAHDFGLDITVSDESELLLDTGGGMARAIELLGEDSTPLLVHNADILTDFPLMEMIVAHDRTGADATLLCARRESSRQFLFDNRMRLQGWENLSSGEVLPPDIDPSTFSQMAFGGIHLLDPRAQKLVVKRFETLGKRPFPITPFYVEHCRELYIDGVMPLESYHWHDIGTPAKLAAAESLFN